MLDHISIPISDYVRSQKFYDAVLGTLDYERLMNFEEDLYLICGYGKGHKPFFWISGTRNKDKVQIYPGFHVAFQASSKKEVDTWYDTALKEGGQDNGPPGYRIEYYPGYYAAFIIDPDGWHIEAVFHDLSKVQ